MPNQYKSLKRSYEKITAPDGSEFHVPSDRLNRDFAELTGNGSRTPGPEETGPELVIGSADE